jgi:hypothetical protein
MAQKKDRVVVEPDVSTPEGTVAAALKAGLAGDFNAYLATVHPDFKKDRKQVEQRRRYEWKRFSKQASWYVKARTPFTIVVAKHDQESQTLYRIFIRDQTRPDRMPVPVRLKKSGTVWKIVTNSL